MAELTEVERRADVVRRRHVLWLTGREPGVEWQHLKLSEQSAWIGRSADDWIARQFHEEYERLAPDFGYETRAESAKPWEDVPEQNRSLMRAVVRSLKDRNVIG